MTKSMTDSWIERGIKLSSAEVDELQNAKGIKRIRAFFQSKFTNAYVYQILTLTQMQFRENFDTRCEYFVMVGLSA